MQAAQATQAALAETLISRLASYGLPVERLPVEATPPPNTLLVQGQIGAVIEGNRSRRTLTGLDAGQSSIAANAQLYSITDPSQPQFVQSFSGTADSGRKPGAAETMGAKGPRFCSCRTAPVVAWLISSGRPLGKRREIRHLS